MPMKPKFRSLERIGDVFYNDGYPVAQQCTECDSIVSICPCTEENLKTVSDPKYGRALVLDCPTCRYEERRRLKGFITWRFRPLKWKFGFKETYELALSCRWEREIFSLRINLGPLHLHMFTNSKSL